MGVVSWAGGADEVAPGTEGDGHGLGEPGRGEGGGGNGGEPVCCGAGFELVVESGKRREGDGGAAGGVEAIFSLLSIRDGIIPPTINLENPGEGCDLDYVPNTARATDVNIAISNSFGFGGTNGSLVFRKFTD